jgi:hypothetical protein
MSTCIVGVNNKYLVAVLLSTMLLHLSHPDSGKNFSHFFDGAEI